MFAFAGERKTTNAVQKDVARAAADNNALQLQLKLGGAPQHQQ